MKLRNKKTGEINILKVNEDYFNIYKDDGEFVCPVTLKELNDGWEDYEESYWYIDAEGTIICEPYDDCAYDNYRKQIGNYFETKEEAEKAVEKLKAWKRLKEAGFYFVYDALEEDSKHKFILRLECDKEKIMKPIAECESLFNDLKILFGGEE